MLYILVKKVTIKEISVTGDLQCGNCQQAKEKIPDMAKKAGAKFEFNTLRSQKGLEIAKKHVDKKGNVDIPIIIIKKEECSKKACSVEDIVLQGFDEKKVKRKLGL